MSIKSVVILGASPDPARFAHKALQKLKLFGHKVILVNPGYEEIEGQIVLASLSLIKEPIDTLTVYVSPDKSAVLVEDILDLRPQRVIFNPGSESSSVIKALEDHRIGYVKACTLVMLDVGAF